MSAQPFDALDVGSNTTVFYREAPNGSEGFIVDNLKLVEVLKERVLDERGLAEVVEVSGRGSSLLKNGGTDGAFQHQFADPLSSVTAWLHLAPLQAPETELFLLPLTIFLALAIIVGLYLLYRLAATQVEFAERQNSFVSAVTHELKTPLTAIRLHSEMLQDGLVESPEKAQEYYRTITAQAERLSRLIGNVLWLSNVERNPGALPEVGDLKAAITQTARALGPHVEKSGFTLVLDLPGDMPHVFRDPDSVEQILFNLVDNALKYAKGAKDRRITLSAEVSPTGVDVVVRDRGPGVSTAKLKKIFEPFFRGEDELTRKNPGTGLGLALVDHLARRMNAKVSAQNAHPGVAVSVHFVKAKNS